MVARGAYGARLAGRCAAITALPQAQLAEAIRCSRAQQERRAGARATWRMSSTTERAGRFPSRVRRARRSRTLDRPRPAPGRRGRPAAARGRSARPPRSLANASAPRKRRGSRQEGRSARTRRRPRRDWRGTSRQHRGQDLDHRREPVALVAAVQQRAAERRQAPRVDRAACVGLGTTLGIGASRAGWDARGAAGETESVRAKRCSSPCRAGTAARPRPVRRTQWVRAQRRVAGRSRHQRRHARAVVAMPIMPSRARRAPRYDPAARSGQSSRPRPATPCCAAFSSRPHRGVGGHVAEPAAAVDQRGRVGLLTTLGAASAPPPAVCSR